MDVLITFYDVWRRSHGRLVQDVFATSQNKAVTTSISDQYKTSLRSKIRLFMDVLITFYYGRLMDVFYRTSHGRLLQNVFATSQEKTIATSISDLHKTSLRPKIRGFMDVFKTSCGRLGSCKLINLFLYDGKIGSKLIKIQLCEMTVSVMRVCSRIPATS